MELLLHRVEILFPIVARGISAEPGLSDFENRIVQKSFDEAFTGLVAGSDVRLGFCRASRIASRTESLISMENIKSHSQYGELKFIFGFLLPNQKYPFLILIFWFDDKGKNSGSQIIGWVGPDGRPSKRNVYN
jgi:hypothetical protein